MSKSAVMVALALAASGAAVAEWIQVGAPAPTANVRVLEQNSRGVTFEVTVPGVEVTGETWDGRRFSRLTFPGGYPAQLVVGRPEVPMVPVLLAIPTGARVNVQIISSETRELQVGAVSPLQPPIPIGHQPDDFIIDQSYYGQDAAYPAEDAAVASTGGWRDLNVASIHVYPVHVNPGRGLVLVASRVVVRVDFFGGAYPQAVAGWMIPIYARAVVNWPELRLSVMQDDPDATKLLVICDGLGWTNAGLRGLLDWTTGRGLKVQIETLSSAQHDPDSIKARIAEVYNSTAGHQLRWVMLVGEFGTGYGQLPMKLLPSPCSDSSEPPGGRYGDFWYTDLDDTAFDYFPEVGVGRLSVADAADLSNQATKILGYQTEPERPYDWLSTAQLVAHKQGDHAFLDYMRLVQDTVETPLNFFGFSRPLIDGQSQGNSDVAAAVGSGVGVLMYFGHGKAGGWDFWGTQGDWLATDVADLNNGAKTPVVWQQACHCSNLSEPTCISEAWMRKEGGGAVACFGGFHVMYMMQGNPDAGDPLKDFLYALGADSFPQVGGGDTYPDPVFSLGDVQMYTQARFAILGDPQRLACELSMICLGDPSMPIWSGGAPKMPVVSYPGWISTAAGDVAVTVAVDGTPVCSALVCLYKDPDVYATGRTNGQGVAIVHVPAHAEGTIAVTVTEGHARQDQQGVAHTPILPFTNGTWTECAKFLAAPSDKAVTDGGWLDFDSDGGLIYAAKGNKKPDFYRYDPANDDWLPRAPIPLGTECKPPYKGCRGVCDGSGHVYMTKGNNKQGFWLYDVGSNAWTQKANVPLGPTNKKVRGGTDLVYVDKDEAGRYVYLLKGYKNEFWRYDIANDTWQQMQDAPVGCNEKWDRGSWLAYDGEHTIYAHKAKYNEFWSFDTDAEEWSTTKLTPMPLVGQSGKIKKLKDGGCGVWLQGSIWALKGGGTQEAWRYDVSQNSWSEAETVPKRASYSTRSKRIKAGADITCVGGTLYALKGNKTLEMWRYTPVIQTYTPPEATAGGELMAVRPGDGGLDEGETPVLEGMEAYTPRWRSNGTAIVVSSEDSLDWLQIWKIAYSGGVGSITQLTDVEMDCEQPVFNPAGTQVAFTLDDDSTGFYQIAVVSAGTGGGGGGGGTDGAEGDVSTSAADAQVSPRAGSSVACPTGSVEAGGEMNVEPVQDDLVSATPGAGAIQASYSITVLTSDEYDHYDPAWSPDGNYIVYTKDGDDGRSHIWRIPATGGQEEQLTFGSTCEEVEPSYINADEVVFTSIPDGDDYDQIGKVNVSTHDVTALTSSETDHEAADPAANGSAVAFQALDEAGNFQIAKVSSSGGSETFLTESDQDMEEPDWSSDNQSVFCVRWTGITSAICRVDAQSGGYVAVTDSSAIRDNPDVWYNPTGSTSYIVYEREAWDEGSLLGFGRGRKRGTGVFLSKHRKPMDGPMGGSLYTFTLDRAEPNPATNRVTIRWSLPKEADVSLKVYSTAGRLVRTLAEGKTRPGTYTTVWDGTDAKGRELASGIYFYRLDAGDKRISRKVVLQH